MFDEHFNILEGADAASFEILSHEIVKDKNYVYSENYPSGFSRNEKLDAPSTEILGEKKGYQVIRDKYHVYLFYNESFNILQNINPLKFEKIYENIYVNSQHMFDYKGRIIASFSDSIIKKTFNHEYVQSSEGGNLHMITIDRNKMRHLKYGIFTDENEVFSLEWSKVFKNADPSTFEVMNDVYSKDKNRVFKQGQHLKGVDPDTFELLTFTEYGSFSRDKTDFYWDGIRLKETDIETFEILSNDYAKDKDHVYFHSLEITDADMKTFKILHDSVGIPSMAVDKNQIFWTNKPMPNIHPNSILKIVGTNQWLDNEFWYAIIPDENSYGYKLLKCPRTKASNLPTEEYYILDGQVHYSGGFCEGEIIKDADWQSFEVLNENYTKDKNNVYYRGKPLVQFVFMGPEKLEACKRDAYLIAQELNQKGYSADDVYEVLDLFFDTKPPRNKSDFLIRFADQKIANMSGADTLVLKINPKSIKLFGGNHGKDDKYYFRNESLFLSRSHETSKFDFATFESVGGSWSTYKDKKQVYNDDLKIIDKADSETIVPIYLKDK